MARKWWTLMAVSVATFMLLLDITVVNTALPSIAKDLGASFNDLQWVVDAYTLSLAAVVLTAGSLADRFGRRLLFSGGLVAFAVASLAAGLAPDATVLNIARAIQGIGGAAMFAVSLALLAQEFPAGRERGTALGIYGATIGISVAVGPLVGGVITSGLGWRWVFFLNVPIGIAALAITRTQVRESRDPNASRVDWPGLTTLSGGLFALVFALLRGNDQGWSSPLILGLFAAAAVLLVAFVLVERRVSEPMLPLELFRSRAFTGVQFAAFAVSASLFALFLYLTLYLQDYLGYSPLQAGLRYLPVTLGQLLRRAAGRRVARPGSGPGTDDYRAAGHRWRPAADVRRAGRLGVDRAPARLRPRGRWRGAAQSGDRRRGAECGAQGAQRHGRRYQRHVPTGRRGRWRGGLGAIFLGRASAKVASLASGTPAATGGHPRQLVEALTSGHLAQAVRGVPHGAREAVVEATRQGFLTGFNAILVIGALIAITGAALALWLVREREIERDQPERAVGRTDTLELSAA